MRKLYSIKEVEQYLIFSGKKDILDEKFKSEVHKFVRLLVVSVCIFILSGLILFMFGHQVIKSQKTYHSIAFIIASFMFFGGSFLQLHLVVKMNEILKPLESVKLVLNKTDKLMITLFIIAGILSLIMAI